MTTKNNRGDKFVAFLATPLGIVMLNIVLWSSVLIGQIIGSYLGWKYGYLLF